MIKIIKLTNGIEVVGKVVEENDTVVVVEDPLQINYRYFITHAYPAVTLTKYLLFTDERAVSFKQSMVLNSVSPRNSFKEYYIAQADKSISDLEQVIDKELSTLADEQVEAEQNILSEMPTPKFFN